MSGLSKHYDHNKKIYDKLKIGDRVKFDRGVYSHWGIYIGLGRIVHLAGSDNDGIDANFNSTHLFSIAGKMFNKAEIRIDNFWSVVGNDKAYIDNSLDGKWSAFDPQTIVQNATQRIGEVGYNVIYSNCEHFTNWCRYGESKSQQVDNVLTGLAVGASFLLGGLAIYGLSKYGQKEKPRKE